MFDFDLYSNANNSSRSTIFIDLSLCLLLMKPEANSAKRVPASARLVNTYSFVQHVSVWEHTRGKEDPLEIHYVILINIHENKCQHENQPRKNFFRDTLNDECIFGFKDINSNFPFSHKAQ